MTFSIIIVNYNTKDLLKNCLDSIFLYCNNVDFEIVVVDNNSNDKSVEMLKNDFGDKIKLIANQNNKGFGSANNQGAKLAKEDILFFLNSDTIIKNNILVKLRDFFKNNNNVGIVAPKLLMEDGEEQPFAFGKFPRLFNIIFDKFKKPPRYMNVPFGAEWVSGAALLIRKDLFNKIDGFDENFFMYFEDIDLCKRVIKSGYKVMVYPLAGLTHLHAKSPASFVKRKNDYYKAQDYFYKKNYGFFGMYLIKFIRFIYKIKK